MIKEVIRHIKAYKNERDTLVFNAKYIKKLLATCPSLNVLTEEQKKQVQEYYRRWYGKGIPDLRWHEYFYTRTGVFSEKYIPNYIIADLHQHLYDVHLTTAYDDKNLYYTLFPDIVQPLAYINCINGYCYHNGKPISKVDSIEICNNIGEVIIKPSYCSCSGNGVRKLLVKDGRDIKTNKKISDIIEDYGKNFVIQEVIKQHSSLAKLCPTALNTIRILTYRREQEVVVIYALLRIGKKGAEIDNTTAGGIVCKIEDNGCLGKYAYMPYPTEPLTQNEEGITFEGYEIPHYKLLIETAKKLHLRMPHFDMIGWDLTINDKGDVVFIEMNAPFGYVLHQIAGGPGFGKYTEEIFERYLKNR